MGNNGNPRPDHDKLYVQEVYTTIYNEIVKPDRIVPVSYYFLREWLPRLSPGLAWLIILMRQRCFWDAMKRKGNEENWTIVDQEELAEALGCGLRTIKRYMKDPDAKLFIVEVKHRYRYDQKLGKQVRQKTRYKVRMDDPLTPEDEEKLKQRMQQRLAGIESEPDPESGQLQIPLDSDNHLSAILALRSLDLSAKMAPINRGQNGPKQTHVLNKDSVVVVKGMLEDFGVADPALSRLLTCDPHHVETWIVYCQDHDLGPGYLISRLRDGDLPPPGYLNPPEPAEIPDVGEPAAPAASQANAWREIQASVRIRTTQGIYETWIAPAVLNRVEGDTYVIGAATDQALIWLEKRLQRTILDAIRSVTGNREAQVSFEKNPVETETTESDRPTEPT